MRNNVEACASWSCIMWKTWYLGMKLGYYRKKNGELGKGGGGVEDMKFPGVIKKKQVHFPGVIQKQCDISRGDQEKVMWNFYKGLCFRP